MEVVDTALMLGFLLLLGERITRIVMDKKASRRNGVTGMSNPGHNLAGPLASLATLSSTVLAVTERTEALVKENNKDNRNAHANLHTRIDSVVSDVGELKVLCGILDERSKP